MAGHVAFLAADEAHGREPWISDGTVEGTHLLKDTCRGGCGVGNLWFQAAGAHLYFVIENSALWRSDGTEAGTEQLPTPSFVEIFDEWEVLELGGKLFVSSLTVYGNELWVHGEDGESRLVADLSRGAPSSSPQSLTAQGGRLFFTACDGTGRGLWQSPASGLDASPLPAGASSPCRFDDMPSRLVAGNVLYVSRNDPNRHPQLWRSDGTGAGTFQLTDAPYGIMAGDDRNPGQWNMAPLQGKLIFGVSRSTPSGHEELWESDGTVQGTRKASYLPDRNDYLFLRAAGNEVYFFTFDQNIAELWRSDGTAAGTRKLANASPPREEPQFLWAGNLVYFLAWAPGVNAMQIWRTDGTAAGTRTLLDGNHGSSDSYVPSLTAFQGNLIAFTEDAQGNEVLWRSDGTAAGTVPLRSFPYPRHAVRPAHTFAAAAGKLFFNQLDDEHGAELWVTDGTAQGTSLFKDVHPGPRSSNPVWLTAAGNRLFFSAHDGEHGIELWSSDGTAAGTRMVQDIAAEGLSASPAELTAVGDRLFFSADDGATGRELWSLPLTGAGGCQASSSRLCLNHGRYQVEASWRTADGAQGRGTAVPLSADTGYFWFFSASNLEVIVKVLDGQGVNGHVWVFYGALSDVEYTLTVTDTQTGLTRQYFNPRGQLASVGDTQGFGPLGAFSTSPGASAASATPPPLIAQRTGQATAAPCQASAQTLCLNEDRFTVDVSWKDFQGNTGKGTAVPLTGDTGTFWFFNSANTELVIKILDGRPVNNKFWLFYGALSNVEYTLRVTDTQTGKMRTYTNPSGRFASVADTDAF
jgi:ELWxxDGT repeat protein